MKKIILLLLIFGSAYAQPPGQWMWIHGSNQPVAYPNWGTQGIPSPTNVPGAVYEPCQWTDLNGNFWLFGGMGPGYFAALWKYNPSINQWTWMTGPNINTPFAGNFGVQGVPSSTNLPPTLYFGAASWTDLQGNLWLFGGHAGNSIGTFSALWKYEISTNMWTWMKGPSSSNQPGIYGTKGVPDINNNPGPHTECATAWTDNSGDLWLFGGGTSTGLCNDLWRFNIATNTWTWMKGDSAENQPGVYGTLNIEDSTNTPGARFSYAHWKDNLGNLWLMGGQIDFLNQSSPMNDFWMYNILTNNWKWKGGASLPNTGNYSYGGLCNPDSSTFPFARWENRSVITDQHGNFWLFGGGVGTFLYVYGDLWMYCLSTEQWSLQGGIGGPNPQGDWGFINTPSPTNVPDGRVGAVTWYDNNNHIYLFGGSGFPFGDTHNDMWKFTIDPNCNVCPVLSVDITSTNETCYGQCISSATAYASNGYPPYTFLWSNSQATQFINALCAGTYTVTVTDSSGHSVTSSVSITQPPQLIANLSSTSTDLSCTGTATVVPGGGTPPYQVLWNNSSTTATISNLCFGWYSVTITDANDCQHSDSVYVSLNSGLANAGIEGFSISPNPVTSELIINFGKAKQCNVYLYDTFGKMLEQTQSGVGFYTLNMINRSIGIYFIAITDEKGNRITKKIIKM